MKRFYNILIIIGIIALLIGIIGLIMSQDGVEQSTKKLFESGLASKTLQLTNQGWRWHEVYFFIYRPDEFGQFQGQSAMFGTWIRKNLEAKLGFDGEKPYIKAKDKNTKEIIKVKYGIHFIHPMFVYKIQNETRKVDFDWNKTNDE